MKRSVDTEEDKETNNADNVDQVDVEKRKRKRKHKKKASDIIDDDGNNDTTSTNKDGTTESTCINPALASKYVNEKTLYIEGLPFECSESDVREFFESCGAIMEVRLPRWHDSGRLRGYGHVVFTTLEGATAGLEMNGKYIGKRFIKVTIPMTPRALMSNPTAIANATKSKPIGCKTIFIKNLPYECTEDDIKQVMRVCGRINNVRLAVWGHTGKLKGFGYIDYEKEESAEIAVKKGAKGELSVKGRPVVCDFEGGAAKASFKSK